MQTFIEQVLEILFPPSADMRRVRACDESAFAAEAVLRTVAGTTCLLDYRDPTVRAAIHEAKFHANSRAVALLARVLTEHINAPAGAIVVPMPLAGARKRERGWNQVELIVQKALKSIDSFVCETRALKKTRNTKPQTSLSRTKRLTNVTDAYSVRDPARVTGKDIVLVDDVLTTGATMAAAKAALSRHHPASLTCIALAH